ncbi:MAG: peptidoglycan editing factor PgeF [Rhodocyclaceae bacterium]|nr:peptidoglycan editing factor PgeF [Rhodocyclaceae bacterium]MCP5232812.1 peptidoglycan editing factor PgeF [Zoogloeaceae bacterium]MCB1911449.1 peptidoglycan editing factor PgeF [Rhodocyclaceae bacterium]MCP5238270.1 peptidoglycan editing factor PgeF [Zoogloeaceae bacterium]MCP5255359.1 peptidoglycan editing factor PgeF [Zoogloeaceae bacterium]
MNKGWIVPDWPAPRNVRALSTTRLGGFSDAPYDSLNLGMHVGDTPEAVGLNRSRLAKALPAQPLWLDQVHGIDVAECGRDPSGTRADASVARGSGLVCAVMTADCLPVLFCDEAGAVVAAAHAGWRGLEAGVLEAAVRSMRVPPSGIMAWLGPAIGPQHFEVGGEVREAFLRRGPEADAAFKATGNAGKWLADLYLLARQRLWSIGVERVCGGNLCTFADPGRFYSYRRDKVTGRMASMVWLE